MIVDATDHELETTPWMARAACRDADEPDRFFPDQGHDGVDAKLVCVACPVRPECLDYALRWDIRFGIWGGLSTRERRRLPRGPSPRRLPPVHGSPARYRAGCRCGRCVEAKMAGMDPGRGR